MTVYGELLFLENLISGMIILMLTERICSRKRHFAWVIAGSILCGAYAFILLVPLNWLMALLSKLAFSLIVVILVYRPENRRQLLKITGVFYIVSFLMGGITIALMYFVKAPGMAANGSVYLDNVTYLHVLAGILLTWIAGVWLAEHLKEKLQQEIVIQEVKICIDENSWEVRALIDTGNSLREPISGYPVAVISRTLGDKIKEELQEDIARRTCIIPYKSVGSKGLLYGIRPDAVVASGESVEKIILGISQDDFKPWKGSENYEVLLHQQLLRGGSKS